MLLLVIDNVFLGGFITQMLILSIFRRGGGGGFGGGGITFAPQITIQGNADRSVIDEALAEAQARFEAWYLQMQRRNARTAY